MTTVTEDHILASLITDVCEKYEGAIKYEDIEQACGELAELILEHPDAAVMVAELVRPRFLARRRGPVLRAERAAVTLAEPDAEPHDHPDTPTGRGQRASEQYQSKQGRYRPRAPEARDDAAEAAQLAFLDLPIAVKKDGPYAEVLWRDATRPMLVERADWYAGKILGLAKSESMLRNQIAVIDEAGGGDEMTLGEAYRVTGRM